MAKAPDPLLASALMRVRENIASGYPTNPQYLKRILDDYDRLKAKEDATCDAWEKAKDDSPCSAS